MTETPSFGGAGFIIFEHKEVYAEFAERGLQKGEPVAPKCNKALGAQYSRVGLSPPEKCMNPLVSQLDNTNHC